MTIITALIIFKKNKNLYFFTVGTYLKPTHYALISLFLSLSSVFLVISMDLPLSNPRMLLNYGRTKDWNSCLNYLLQYEGSLDCVDATGHTLLHLAIIDDQSEMVEWLIRKKANVNIKSIGGPVTYNAMTKQWTNRIQTPLHYAAQLGNNTIVELLLNTRIDINSTFNQFGNTPLHLSVWFGHDTITQLLIEHSADLDKSNAHGSSPTHLAAWRNEPQNLKMLINNGACFLESNTTGIGNTPLYLAAKTGAVECLSLLINACKKDTLILEQICSRDKSTAIQAAGTRQHTQCYWNLVCAGADYKKTYSDRNTDKNISELITDNSALKSFVRCIELNGAKTAPTCQNNLATCSLCHNGYKKNDTTIKINCCKTSFHTTCLENRALHCSIEKHKNTTYLQWLKNKPVKEIIFELKTNGMATDNWNIIDKCPNCKSSINMDKDGTILVFMP